MPGLASGPLSFAPPTSAREVSEGIFAYIQPDGTWWMNNTSFSGTSVEQHIERMTP